MTAVASNKTKTVHRIPAACADEAKAVEFLESMRWGDTPACPRCGDTNVYQMKDRETGERNARFLWRCKGCKKQFTVRVGTVMEDSAIPLRHWVFAFWAASASKKGVSSLQIQRQTGLSYKSALFLMHRIRWAMQNRDGSLLSGDVEVDETYVGGKPRSGRNKADPAYTAMTGRKTKRGRARDFKMRKTPVVAMVERDGDARCFVPTDVTGDNLRRVLWKQIDRAARLHTDEAPLYDTVGKYFDGGHYTVNHSEKDYVHHVGSVEATTNTVEAFFAILKRGVIGTFHNVSRKHLHHYVSEFEFRWNSRKMDDGARLQWAIRSGEGKRPMYAMQVR